MEGEVVAAAGFFSPVAVVVDVLTAGEVVDELPGVFFDVRGHGGGVEGVGPAAVLGGEVEAGVREVAGRGAGVEGVEGEVVVYSVFFFFGEGLGGLVFCVWGGGGKKGKEGYGLIGVTEKGLYHGTYDTMYMAIDTSV